MHFVKDLNSLTSCFFNLLSQINIVNFPFAFMLYMILIIFHISSYVRIEIVVVVKPWIVQVALLDLVACE